MSIRTAFATTILLALLGGSALAQSATAAQNPNWQGRKKYFHIEQRENNQQKRIDQGIENGSLTPREAGRLEAQQARFERAENRDRASGDKLTLRERKQLYRLQNHDSRDVYRAKHNRRHQ